MHDEQLIAFVFMIYPINDIKETVLGISIDTHAKIAISLIHNGILETFIC